MNDTSVTICPTILAEEPHGLNIELKRVLSFAKRLHIDLMDGLFASPKSVTLDQIHWPANIAVDLHVMYQKPLIHANALIALRPQMVIVHAEAEGNFMPFANKLHRTGIEVGVALLPETSVATIVPALEAIDHVLIFSGHLGHFGGRADVNLLAKAQELKSLKPTLEIGWDGGVNTSNAAKLASGGIHVLNVGGFIQHARSPQAAYEELEKAVN